MQKQTHTRTPTHTYTHRCRIFCNFPLRTLHDTQAFEHKRFSFVCVIRLMFLASICNVTATHDSFAHTLYEMFFFINALLSLRNYR